MYDVLRARSIDSVFHFTDSYNVSSIKELGGLFSRSRLLDMKVKNVRWGGNEWSHNADDRSGMDKYVHLCFLAKHPMEYHASNDGRIEKTKWLQIDISVLNMKNVLYTAEVSNKTGASTLVGHDARGILDIEALYGWIDYKIPENQERRNMAEKYEILIPDHVPLKYIKNI